MDTPPNNVQSQPTSGTRPPANQENPSRLPAEVQAVRTLEQKQAQQQNSNSTTTNLPQKTESKDKAKRNKRVFIASLSAFFIALIIFIFVLISWISDSSVSIEGTVTDLSTGVAIENATITVNEEAGSFTDEDGFYSIPNLSTGRASVTVEADSYETQQREITLTTGLLRGGTSIVNFELVPLEVARIEGSLISNDTTVNFTFNDALVVVDDTSANITSSGTFRIEVPLGTQELQFTSSEFQDFVLEINVTSGTQNVGELEVTPAADITAEIIHYITKATLPDAEVTVTDIPINRITVDENGNLEVLDVEVGREYDIEISLDGFNTLRTSIVTEVGDNQLFNTSLTPSGKAIFFREINRDNQLFTSNYDGTELAQVTEIEDLNHLSEYYNSSTNTVFFLSNHQGVNNTIRGDAFIPYSTDLNNQSTSALFNNLNNLGYIYANFETETFAQITEDPSNNDILHLEVMNSTGNNRTIVATADDNLDESINQVLISNDGNTIFFVKTTEDAPDELFRYFIDTNQLRKLTEGTAIQMIDVSNTQVIFSTANNSLVLADAANNEIRTIQSELTGFDYQFDATDPNTVLFITQLPDDTEINAFNISSSSVEKVLRVENEQVFDLYFSDGYYYYRTENELFIFDRDIPRPGVLVFQGSTINNRDFQYDI